MIDIYTHTQKEKKMEPHTSVLQEPHLCHSLFHFQEFLSLFQTSQTLKKDKLSKFEIIFNRYFKIGNTWNPKVYFLSLRTDNIRQLCIDFFVFNRN